VLKLLVAHVVWALITFLSCPSRHILRNVAPLFVHINPRFATLLISMSNQSYLNCPLHFPAVKHMLTKPSIVYYRGLIVQH